MGGRGWVDGRRRERKVEQRERRVEQQREDGTGVSVLTIELTCKTVQRRVNKTGVQSEHGHAPFNFRCVFLCPSSNGPISAVNQPTIDQRIL